VTSELRGGPPRSRKPSETWGTRPGNRGQSRLSPVFRLRLSPVFPTFTFFVKVGTMTMSSHLCKNRKGGPATWGTELEYNLQDAAR
jgi:hypothetical protein